MNIKPIGRIALVGLLLGAVAGPAPARNFVRSGGAHFSSHGGARMSTPRFGAHFGASRATSRGGFAVRPRFISNSNFQAEHAAAARTATPRAVGPRTASRPWAASPGSYGGAGGAAHSIGRPDFAAPARTAVPGRTPPGHFAAVPGRTYSRPYSRPYNGYRPPSARYGYRHWNRLPWRGGYWRGGYWPAVYYGPSFAWFLATLPAFCTTFWFDSVPYYYVNNVYYLWSPAADGYVATDPPPVDGSVAQAPQDAADAADTATDAAADAADAAPADPAAAIATDAAGTNGATPSANAAAAAAADPDGSLAAAASQVYAYPSGNQPASQQSTDRMECSDWAILQATANGASASPANVRRAMIACLDGRGYSAN